MKSQEINMQKVGLFGVKSLTFWCKKSHFLRSDMTFCEIHLKTYDDDKKTYAKQVVLFCYEIGYFCPIL